MNRLTGRIKKLTEKANKNRMNEFLKNKKILLIIGGGIAAYKSLDLIRLLKKQECEVKVVLTESGKKFVTPLSISSVSQNKDYDNADFSGMFEENMTITIESNIGEVGGKEGVKLEDQYVVTANGFRLMSKIPLNLI